MSELDSMYIGGVTQVGQYRLVMTCGACPEQYEVFWGDRQVGYLRLRHGNFSVSCPDAGGEDVLTANPKGDGIFEPDERGDYLQKACDVIDEWRRNNRHRLGKRVSQSGSPG